MNRFFRLAAVAIGLSALLAAGGVYGASWYYTSEHGQGCASCHEMAEHVSAVHGSPHRNIGCVECHEASLATKLRHIRVHLSGKWLEEIRLRDVDVLAMTAKCEGCHRNEYANWHAGPHSATYGQIFANPTQNRTQRLMDDCLRCHGMHFNGPIRDLVQPINTKGPWHVMRAGLADQPAMPCQTCHWIHKGGEPEAKPPGRISVAGAGIDNSLAFFDRRESTHIAASLLAIPKMYEGARAVTVSQDARGALCYQCHAPREPDTGTVAALNLWGVQVGSGDDRTPIGVHEGLSCVSCHNGHNENARASCKTCHPQMSHCGLNVEKMDTTFASAASKHNIHWVKCADCHVNGVPKMRSTAERMSSVSRKHG